MISNKSYSIVANLTVIIQMFTVDNTYSQNLMVDCLNRLQKIKNKLHLFSHSNQLTSQISQAIKDVKMYLQTIKINKEVFTDMQEEICKLQKQKDRLGNRHKTVLQNLQMLIYQQDYQELKIRLNEFKNNKFDQSITPFTPRLQKLASSQRSQLDRAFVLQDSQSQENQFLSCIKSSQKQNSRLKNALEIIYSSSPFEKKEEVWLEIMYSKNLDEADRLNHVSQKQVLSVKRNQKEITQFQMSLSEQNQPKISKQNDLQCFSGKKIKSMILLKEKSSKKKSKTKTSIKKAVQNQNKQQENAEYENTKLKKKLEFHNKPSQSVQKDKKKAQKQPQIKHIKSFRKTIINNC